MGLGRQEQQEGAKKISAILPRRQLSARVDLFTEQSFSCLPGM